MLGTVIICPGHHKATILQTNHGRLVLGAGGITINTELLCRYRAIVGIDLGPDINPTAGSGAIIVAGTAVIAPGDDETAIFKAGNLGLILAPGKLIGIDAELANSLVSAGIEDTRPNVVARARTGTIASVVTGTFIIAPGHGKAAGIESRHGRFVLGPGNLVFIDSELRRAHSPVRAIDLRPDVITVASTGAIASIVAAARIIPPGNNIAAIL